VATRPTVTRSSVRTRSGATAGTRSRNLVGKDGPSYNRLGGTQIGSTGLWVGDYTIQPENGGLSVFAHEYGHDLGLPDLYDTTARVRR
jgi:M6 family metalloprotease-like protein